ncbi:hypothetical protein C2S51_029040 [Perilla frutescens var. frutescens]|nr:hypothetical protein C2S51_029040 [Perilla frutescens var. frutescens]
MWGERDSMRWNLTSTGEFPLTSTWDQVRYRRPERAIFGSFWHDCLTPTISIFLWRLTHDHISVDVRLQSHRIHLASRCQCCVVPPVESIEHVFLWFESAKSVWAYVANWFHITAPHTHTVAHTFRFWRGLFPRSAPKHISFLIPCLAFWFIWTERNSRKHRGVPFLVSHIIWQNGAVAASGGALGEAQHGWIFLDGSSDGDWRGGLVRDHTGSLLANFCMPLRAVSSFDAEFQALLHSLRLAVQYSDHVLIEMDAASVVLVL